MKTTPTVKSIRDILSLLSEQMETLRPRSKPTKESISAARASATVVNSYLGTVRLGMEGAKINNQKPDLTFLGIPKAKELDQK